MSKAHLAVVGLMVAVLLALPQQARAESAAEAFARGQELMKKAQFDAALEALSIAAKADATNQEYVKRYTVARRVVEFRKRLAAEKDPKQCELLARALRAFYLREDLNDEAIAVAEQLSQKVPGAASTIMLAETQLAVDKNEEAVKTLGTLAADQVTPTSQALLAIGYMDTGKPDQAKQVLSAIAVPADGGPGPKLLIARAFAKSGDAPKAIEVLKACFESVPPPELDKMKASAKSMPEFATIASSKEFAEAMETKSKVDESKCTSGADCATCPLGGAKVEAKPAAPAPEAK